INTLFFHQEKIGAINWGLVAGKTQTYFPWGSPENASTPLVWFHDIFNASGKPFSPYEVQFFKDLGGSVTTISTSVTPTSTSITSTSTSVTPTSTSNIILIDMLLLFSCLIFFILIA
ncbi:unnamed protein product, partial [Adineta steineri]